MAQVNDLINRTMAAVTGAPEPLAVEAYLTAAREFFTNTKLWRVNAISWTIEDASFNYYGARTTNSGDEEIFDISFLEHGSTRLLRSNFERVVRENSRRSGTPRYYTVEKGGIVVFAPSSVTISELFGVAVVRPTLDALDIDDDIVAEYHTVIEQGAMGNLLMMPNQSWTAPETGAAHRQTFLSAIEDFLSWAIHDGTDDVPRRAPMISRRG